MFTICDAVGEARPNWYLQEVHAEKYITYSSVFREVGFILVDK
jgi:hypothetical protein